MKKLISALLLLFTIQTYAFSIETEKTINLHSNSSYILDLKKRPIDLQVTNPRILEADSTTEIYSEQSQLMLTTTDEGISYVTFKQGNINHTIKVLVDNNEKIDSSVTEIDTIKEPVNK